MQHKKLIFRISGFIASLILTLAAYFIIAGHDFFYLTSDMAIAVIFILAVFQSIVQLVCFIDLWKEKGPPWNLLTFVSTISIVLLVVFFTIWIMHHLDYNMMPWMHGGSHTNGVK